MFDAVVEVPQDWPRWAQVTLELTIAGAIGLAVHLLLSRYLRRLLARTPFGVFDILFERARRPAALTLPLLMMLLARSRTTPPRESGRPLPLLDHVIEIGVIFGLTWWLVTLFGALDKYVKGAHDVAVDDNREARRVHTQVTVLSRALQLLAICAGIATALMTFPRVQQIGTSMLASAGIAGVVVGLAARPVLENLIAGLQIGFTQPIRLDDTVVIDDKFGRVEDITMTYIVVRLWDERRLIVPFSKFIAQPFENWTRYDSAVMGTVMLWVDFSTPVDRVRDAGKRIVQSTPYWDGRAFNVQVTDATESAMLLRVLVSARNSTDAWELRVLVREKLIAFLNAELPGALPNRRGETSDAEDSAENTQLAANKPDA